MIAQISHTGNTAGVVSYHDKKIQLGVASIIDFQEINTNSRNNIQASFNSYNAFSSETKPTVHFSINFHADDRPVLTDDLYKQISTEYLNKMGYSDQPFIVYKHKDQAHPHIHIITTKIKDNGNKIPTWGERYRSQNISRNIELSHNLTQVSSIKNERKGARVLSTEKEYLTYLRSSVKDALSLRPKRNSDLVSILRLRYGVDLYNSKKGIGFALLGEHHTRYKNGYGTKGIAASKIDQNWSKSKLSKILSNNFENAPKRYRNLKATETLIKEDFNLFNSISTIDFNVLFETKGTSIYTKDKASLVVDIKGKNIYSERDLKGVEFNKIAKTTSLKNPETSGLFKLIADETLLVYKNDYSKKLLLSSFIEDIAIKDTFLKFYTSSNTYERFTPLLSESEHNKLEPYLASYFDNIDTQINDIKSKESYSFDACSEIVSQFSALTNTDLHVFTDAFRLNIYNESYSFSSSERGALALMEKIIDPKKRFTSDSSIYPGLIFDIHKFIATDKLPAAFQKSIDKILVENYIKSSIHEAKKEFTGPSSLLKHLNDKGISLQKEIDGSITASISNFDYLYTVKGIDDFVSKIDLNKNKLAINFEDIRFNKAFEKEQFSYAFSLLTSDKLSPELSKKYKNAPEFKELLIDKENRQIISSELYNFKSSKDIIYTSDLKSYILNTPEEFINHIQSKSEIPLSWVKEYLEGYTSLESINESTRLEKEHFKNTIELSSRLGNGNLSALLGLKTANKGVISDMDGKYSSGGDIIHSQSIKTLQEQPYFKYYSSVFNEVSFHLYGDKRDTFKLNYSSILVFESFKNHIPEQLLKNYKKTFETAYIDYFVENSTKKETNWTGSERIEYLNSKGIVAFKLRGENVAKLGGSDTHIKTNDTIDFKGTSFDQQTQYIRNNGFNSSGIRRGDQFKFVIALEKENYSEAAWLLKQNKASLSLSNLEPNRVLKLQEELDKLNYDSDSYFKSIIHTLKQDEGGDGHYKGSKSKKGKKRKGPRL